MSDGRTLSEAEQARRGQQRVDGQRLRRGQQRRRRRRLLRAAHQVQHEGLARPHALCPGSQAGAARMHDRAQGSCAVLTAMSGHLSSLQLTSAHALPNPSLQVAAGCCRGGGLRPPCACMRAHLPLARRVLVQLRPRGRGLQHRRRHAAALLPPAAGRALLPSYIIVHPLGQGGVAIWCIGTGRQAARHHRSPVGHGARARGDGCV